MAGAGADGILSVRRTTTSRRRRACSSTTRHRANDGLPIVLYNVPGRTGCNIDVCHDRAPRSGHPNIVGVKEASGNMSQMCEVCRRVPGDFIVLSGDDR